MDSEPIPTGRIVDACAARAEAHQWRAEERGHDMTPFTMIRVGLLVAQCRSCKSYVNVSWQGSKAVVIGHLGVFDCPPTAKEN